MSSYINRKLLGLLSLLIIELTAQAQNPVNWTEKQLMEPVELATAITAKKDIPQIISVGPGASIPASVAIGMVNNEAGLEKLKAHLRTASKTEKIVLYCGCCPFEHCPNVRPAINLLKEMKFTNWYLLNLPNNLKKDWIDKGYPVAKTGNQ